MKLTKRIIDATTYHGKVGTANYLWDDELARGSESIPLAGSRSSSPTEPRAA